MDELIKVLDLSHLACIVYQSEEPMHCLYVNGPAYEMGFRVGIRPADRVHPSERHRMAPMRKRLLRDGRLGIEEILTINNVRCEFEVLRYRDWFIGTFWTCNRHGREYADRDPLTTHNLTRTQLEVADLIRKRLTTKAIADRLNISLKTVEFHRYNIRRKLKVPPMANIMPYLFGVGGNQEESQY